MTPQEAYESRYANIDNGQHTWGSAPEHVKDLWLASRTIAWTLAEGEALNDPELRCGIALQLKEIERLRVIIQEQKSEIDRLSNLADTWNEECDDYRADNRDLANLAHAQSALIEKLAEALKHHQLLTRPIDRTYEALAAYTEYKK